MRYEFDDATVGAGVLIDIGIGENRRLQIEEEGETIGAVLVSDAAHRFDRCEKLLDEFCDLLLDYSAEKAVRLAATWTDSDPSPHEGYRRLRTTLAAQPYLAGKRPAYADYIVLGSFQWPRCISPYALLAPDDPIFAWRERMLDAFDGMARRAKAA